MAGPVAGVGVQQCWGFAPGRALLSGWRRTAAAAPARVLLLGAADLRHVLYTAAELEPSDEPTAEFFVHEESVEALARHVLLLAVLTDQDKNCQARAEVFLEVFGNALLRESTAQYVQERAKEVLRVLRAVVDADGVVPCAAAAAHPLTALLDLRHLRFQELDELEAVVAAWTGKPEHDIRQLRDARLRSYYAERFDSRSNLVDWDYFMHLKDVESIVHPFLYKRWRETGLAFEARECTYTQTNPTLVSHRAGVHAKKGAVRVPGVWNDILVSPFVAFGVEAPDRPDLLEVRNQQHVKTCVDVAEHNVAKLVERCFMRGPRRTFRLCPLPPGEAGFAAVLNKSKYRSHFHRLCVAPSHAHHITPALTALLAPAGDTAALAGPLQATVETMRHVPLKDEQRDAFERKLVELASAAGWEQARASPAAPRPAALEFRCDAGGERTGPS